MYQVFDNIEDLYSEIDNDKNWAGEGCVNRNRFPIRFVLFDNFYDFYDFIEYCQNKKILLQRMEYWLNEGSDDCLLTYSQVSKRFKQFIDQVMNKDLVVVLFSEIARFYENTEKNAEFNSLVKTIGGIESSCSAIEQHRRVYIPIIGMQNKMGHFKNDSQTYIWEYKSEKESQLYRLILTRGTNYGVQGLENKYSLSENVRSWISLWSKGRNVKNNIICSSTAIFNNAHYAQPDNAFEYTICDNVYEFLTSGLKLNFCGVKYDKSDSTYWEFLAKEININDFDFQRFITVKFNVVSLNKVTDFLNKIVETTDNYSRWLLKISYIINHSDDIYLKRVLEKCKNLTNTDLFSTIATLIFDESYDESAINERAEALKLGAKLQVKITDSAEKIITDKLTAMVNNPQHGYSMAMKFISPISQSEKSLIIKWLGQGNINRNNICELYPELFDYTARFQMSLQSEESEWIKDYFTQYRNSKIANNISKELSRLLKEKNASSSTFFTWRDSFKTVKTQLINRTDIDLYYWIDGLGVDWIPFIIRVIEKFKVDNIYLNEIYIATVDLPTCTENNKIKLQELCGDKLRKAGDIDEFAHKQKRYPDYIDEEFHIVKKAISDVVKRYNGKKIAFVSDHGISYLASHENGLNIANIKGDHAGRCGEFTGGMITNDEHYVILDDGRTVCALTHQSLTSKVHDGQGAHGGATPEEVLVPIIIVSSQKNTSNYSAKLQSYEITALKPVLTYVVKGLTQIDTPVVEYNGIEYQLRKNNQGEYVSDRLNIDPKVETVTLKIGQFEQKDTVKINTGVDIDNDLLNF